MMIFKARLHQSKATCCPSYLLIFVTFIDSMLIVHCGWVTVVIALLCCRDNGVMQAKFPRVWGNLPTSNGWILTAISCQVRGAWSVCYWWLRCYYETIVFKAKLLVFCLFVYSLATKNEKQKLIVQATSWHVNSTLSLSAAATVISIEASMHLFLGQRTIQPCLRLYDLQSITTSVDFRLSGQDRFLRVSLS